MTRNFNDFLNRKHAEYADKFDDSDLSKQFVPYYNNQKRIKVQFYGEEIKTGTVGVTTGWKPTFLLMLRKNSSGSSYLLSDKTIILGEV
jgi:hypothetical protein